MTSDDIKSASSLKDEGNECIKNGKYKEATLLYTQAIKMEPNNEILYSNRSLSYLKLQQHALALDDAKETIRINQEWAKGYFRKAEAEFALGLIDDAQLSYEMALILLPNDPGILEAMTKINFIIEKKNDVRKKIPWLCSCIGLIFGVVLTIYDYLISANPKLTNPILQVIFIQLTAGSFWLVAYFFIMCQISKAEQEKATEKLPRFYLVLGLIIGLSVVLVDSVFFNFLGLNNSASRIFFALALAGGGWGIGNKLRHRKQQMADSPNDETNDGENDTESLPDENVVHERTSNRYTKAQARYRYKKGKM